MTDVSEMYAENHRAYLRERYQNDPEYRRYKIEHAHAYNRSHREQLNKRRRERHARLRALRLQEEAI